MTASDSPASRTRDPMAFEPPYHTGAATDVSDEFESPGAVPRPRGASPASPAPAMAPPALGVLRPPGSAATSSGPPAYQSR